MNKESLVVRPPVPHNYCLRHANVGDLDRLRIWKNRHKKTFFFQEEISIQQQLAWYQGFGAREADFMFMIIEESAGQSTAIGCLGYRDLGDRIDIYNVMRGEPRPDGGVTIHEAMTLLINYIASTSSKPITCLVLKDNPATAWYQQCGFRVVEERNDCLMLQVDLGSVERLAPRVMVGYHAGTCSP